MITANEMIEGLDVLRIVPDHAKAVKCLRTSEDGRRVPAQILLGPPMPNKLL
jgi:hypothetical protein